MTLKQQIARDRIVGAKLRALRKSKGIQAKFVSTAMGIQPGYLSDLESGHRHWRDELRQKYLKAIRET